MPRKAVPSCAGHAIDAVGVADALGVMDEVGVETGDSDGSEPTETVAVAVRVAEGVAEALGVGGV